MSFCVPVYSDLLILRKADSVHEREPCNKLAFFDAAHYFLAQRNYVADY
jgi:hypothetical protein